MAVFLVVATLTVVIESIRPYWMKLIFESIQNQSMDKVWLYLGLFGFSTVGGNLISAWSFYLGDKVMIPFSREIREGVFNKVMELDFAYHVDKSTGSLISAFRRGDSAIGNLFSNIHQELYRVLINLIVTVYFLAMVDPIMAIFLMVLFVGNMFLIWWLIKINLHTRTEFNKVEDEVSGIIADSMINYETVKFFAAENKEKKRLNVKFDEWSKIFWKYANSFRLMDILIGTTSGLGMLVVMALAIKKIGNNFSVGDFVMVTGFITGFYYQFFNLFFRVRDIAKSMTDLEKYLGIFDNKIIVKDTSRPKMIKNKKGLIEFKKVTFSYPKNKDKVVNEIDLIIKPGQKVALVGRSGTGKTTITKLLLRFYDPRAGVITIDGVDIKKMKKGELRKMMGVVPQEPIMFNNTIKFNLAYGRDTATMEEIEIAAADANILEFIEGLKEKWETKVGERGIKLSGGQKQRLAIARALLTDPKILIFDEATSNLDSESERKIQDALAKMKGERTIIVVAHRLSTIRNSDKIVVLSNGSIVETGTHDELVKLKGIYNKLWTLQSKGKVVEQRG